MMKKMKYFALALLLAGGFAMASCSDDEVATTEVTLGLNLGINNDENLSVKTGTYTFANVSTGLETKVDYATARTRALADDVLATLTDGLYNVTFIGTATYTYTELEEIENEQGEQETIEVTKTSDVNVQGAQENVEVKGGNLSLSLTVYVRPNDEKGNFVIAEIYVPGSWNATSGAQYNGDQYFRIYNNSSETLYADGLVLVESTFMTVTKRVYTPDIMDEAMTVQVVARIPGNGTDHPVAPGTSIVICDNAINHTEANPASADLSKADFEWYTQSTSASNPDVDNPDVPNLDMIYNYTKTIWVLNKQGNRAYAIARLPQGMSGDDYLAEYTYTYNYPLATGAPSRDFIGYKMPNSWIIDAVNISPKNRRAWNVTSQALDMGFTYIGENVTIAENAGKAVVRKTAYTTEEGRAVLMDTNNSSVDFLPAAPATLLSGR